jgi:chemotaxis protein methyltransferase CheR
LASALFEGEKAPGKFPAIQTESIDPTAAGSPVADSHDSEKLDPFRGIVFKDSNIENSAKFPPALKHSITRPPIRKRRPLERLRPGPVGCHEAAFVTKIFRAAGFDPANYRLAPLARRIPACLRALRVETLEEALDLFQSSPTALNTAIHSLLIGTTSFFRDETVFHQLREQVIPDILSRRKDPKIWSIACSEGAELYSVAMLVADYQPLCEAQFYGTDCRSSAIEIAHRGHYHPSALESLPTGFLEKYFTQEHGAFTVSPHVRTSVGWAVSDILSEQLGTPGAWDLILCRNLAIYLDETTVKNLWARLAAALTPGGFLIVGKAEKPTASGLQREGPCIYRKTSFCHPF